MNEKQTAYAKILRQSIMAVAIKKYNWQYDQFHEIMQEWGFGDSLRKLSISRLRELKTTLFGYDYTIHHDSAWEMDSQGKYMWHLMKTAGWNRKRVTTLMIKKFRKTHWNLLNELERRQLINILKGYC